MSLAEEELQEAGRQIGRNYRVIKKLGHGGDGTIYLVRHGPTEQLRAAKLLKADTSGRRRHELDMMKRLKHPALPQIYDVLEEQGNFWIIMEFISGKTLSEFCAGKKMGAAYFYSIAGQLAEALVYLHSRKPPVLHLDIKPSNIMVQPDGTVVLIDFGAAVRADAKSASTACFGTPGFAAPEQWNPKIEPDVRADYYGYGAVLYYCLYGQVPGTQNKIQKNDPRGNREAAFLIRRCMQEDRDRRFPDTLSLYRSVKRAERRYFARRKLCRGSAALLFLLAATVFAAVNLCRDDTGEAAAAVEAQTRHGYGVLLEQADSLGLEQAVLCYEQAAGLCPEDGTWCDRFLGRIEADYIFSLEEEEALKKLLFSVPPGMADTEEKLMEDSAPGYGRLAYRIGLMYWYFYEGAGGKSAAAKWFERAVGWQEKQEEQIEQKEQEEQEEQEDTAEWLEAAQIYAKISGYYETLGKQSPDGDSAAEIRIYWEDLVSLWKLDSLGRDSLRIRCEVAQELLSVLIMQSAELRAEGISTEQLQEVLTLIGLFAEEIPESEQTAKTCREQYQAAREALERLTENERGNGFGTEKKK